MTKQRTLEFPATFRVEPLEPLSEEPSILSSLRKKQQIMDEQHPSFLREYVTTEQLVVGIYDQWVSKDIVGVQPMEGPIGLVYTLAYRSADDNDSNIPSLEVFSECVEAGTTRYAFNNGYIDLDNVIDELSDSDESAHLAEFIDAAANEIDAEVVHDLRTIATTRRASLSDVPLDMILNHCATEIASMTKRGAGNHFIFGKKVYDFMFDLENSDFNSNKALNKVGTVWNTKSDGTRYNRRHYYTSNVLKDNEILVAYKGGSGEVDCNYFYCPYVMVVGGGDVVNPHNFRPAAGGISRRYGKKISTTDNDGKSTYHQLITLEDL